MKRWPQILAVTGLALLFAGFAAADTLELKDGRVLQGKYLGGTQAVMRFEVDGQVQTFSTNNIVALTFTGRGSAAPAPQSAAPETDVAPSAPAPNTPPSAPAPNSAQSSSADRSASGEITLPAGQGLLVRMIDGVDSTKNHVGDIFHASLETDLSVDGTLVARKGSDVYGKLVTSEQSGKFAGHSELQLELTSIMIDGRSYPLVSSDYNVQGKGRGADTAKKVGGLAAVGAIIGAVAGGGKGAAIGAAAGGATGAGVQVLTKGDQVRIPSETLLEFRLQQPVTVTPAAS